MVVGLEMVACSSREEHQKLVVTAAASTRGLAIIAAGHDEAFDVDEKLLMLRGMIVVLSESCP